MPDRTERWTRTRHWRVSKDGIDSSGRCVVCLDQRQPASGATTLSEMSPRSSGVDLAWKYGLVCLVMDHPGGV